MKKLSKMHTYPDIYEAAYGQKLCFAQFIVNWMEKQDIPYFKEEVIISSICKAGWKFFEEELIEYFQSCPDLYTLNDDGTVTILES